MTRLPPGQILGARFEILGVLGEGGMATVYLAQDRLREERVALKLLHRHLAASPSMRARLRREVIAASHLRHPNALVAHELHELDGHLGLSMPVCTGATLSEHVAARGPLSAEALRRLGLELAGVLAQAHGAGIVHRDITPNNVMVAPEGHALLMDFGLARLDGGRTATGTGVLGTAGYAAPEVYDGVRADPRSDLYSLGAALYFAATGHSPFAAPTPVATLKRQLADDRVSLDQARPDLPPDLSALIEALLRVDPEQRPAGPSAVLDALTHGGLVEEAPAPVGPELSLDPESLRPKLPAGGWAVELHEAEPLDLVRRARLRGGYNPHGAGLEGILRRIVTEIADGVRSAFDIPAELPPEQRLMQGIAALGELPPEALRPNPVLFEERFLLAAGVDEATARALADQARPLGFQTYLHRAGAPSKTQEQLRGLMYACMGLLFAAAASGSWGLAMIAGAVGMALYMGRSQAAPPPRFPELPVAYSADLRPALTQEYRQALEALEQRHAESWSSTQETPERPPARPERQAESPLPPAGRRAMAQLDALEASLQRQAEQLAPVVIEDLTRTLHQLRTRCAALSEHARALQQELETQVRGAGDAAGDAARVEARLERLAALEAMGQAADPAEQASLRQALAQHQAAMAEQERLEADLTRALAELLEIGAHATRARRSLLSEADIRSSATDLLSELRGKVDAARAASQETDDAERKRRARAAQAAKQRR
ncbi:MAG: protein kinase [Alphaproteobacteria bacterium]|nr:protein kinase [Alphaproteobacteria bacterium]